MEVRSKPKRWLFWLAGAVLLVGAGLGVTLYLMYGTKAGLIPAKIKERLDFPVYVPDRLPGDFKIAAGSFSIDQGVLIFKAQDTNGATIAFTEQRKPQNVDFDDFNDTQLADAKKIDGAPFSSTAGTAAQGSNMVLSVVADKTWIIMTSGSLGDKDIELIAQSIRLSQ